MMCSIAAREAAELRELSATPVQVPLAEDAPREVGLAWVTLAVALPPVRGGNDEGEAGRPSPIGDPLRPPSDKDTLVCMNETTDY